MTTVTLDLPDEKLERLEVIARAHGTSVPRLFEEMSSVMLAEADAETRFRLRARRGAGKEARGLELLAKSASRSTSANPPADS
jgi:hypothetical protein